MFKLGERVTLTKDGISSGFRGRATSNEGTVVGYSRLSDQYIRVRRDGIKQAKQYSVKFWKRASR